MKKIVFTCVIVLLAGAPLWAGQPSSFDSVIEHYEPIRMALVADSMEGVTDHGTAIVAELEALQADFSPEHAGVSTDAAASVKAQLPAMIAAAKGLAEAVSLDTARAAFYELSKPLVQWREGTLEVGRPSVAYCPMHKKSWLQPGSTIGNPYGGMPGCGSIISK